MEQIRIYKDSKVIPVHIYERIESTGDFFYMIKGYEDGDIIDYDVEILKSKFDEIVQDYVISINSKSIDIANYGLIYSGTLLIEMLNRVKEIVLLQAQSNLIGETVNYKSDNTDIIKDFLKEFKLPYKEDIEQQISIIDARISKIENDIAVAQKKIDDKPIEVEAKDYDILQDVTFVERVLKIQIDVYKTSLYRLGLHKLEAVKEIERLIKQNNTNGRK